MQVCDIVDKETAERATRLINARKSANIHEKSAKNIKSDTEEDIFDLLGDVPDMEVENDVGKLSIVSSTRPTFDKNVLKEYLTERCGVPVQVVSDAMKAATTLKSSTYISFKPKE